MGVGFCRYDITKADNESMKLLMICLVSSLYLVLLNEMQEQYTATQAHHLIRIIKAHIDITIPKTFI